MSDFKVNIEYKNKHLQTVNEREYDFQQYVEMLQLELMRIIMDVEDAFYQLQNNTQKDDWSPLAMELFQKIRHKLLDTANSIKRLPSTLCYKGVPCDSKNLSEVIADILNKNE